jgi:hypothetical protein
MKLCECGCGKPTKIAESTRKERGVVKGQPNNFLQGHGKHKYKNDYAAFFWSHVNKHGPKHPVLGTNCWLWTASLNAYGYGQFNYKGKIVIAHRLAWLLTYGMWPKNFLCHHCDTPACVRPAHEFDGTPKENMQDASRKGRCHGNTPKETK